METTNPETGTTGQIVAYDGPFWVPGSDSEDRGTLRTIHLHSTDLTDKDMDRLMRRVLGGEDIIGAFADIVRKKAATIREASES